MPTVPLLGNVADLASSQAAQVTVPLMPTGSVISYAGSTAPSGWLLCDGALLSTTTYASLFAIIGYTFGGSGGTFNLPDLRGRFVRYDDNMGNHGIAGVTAAGPATRDSGRSHGSTQTQTTAKNGLTNTSTTSGAMSANSTHSHDFQYNASGGNSVQPGFFTQGGSFYSTSGATTVSIGMNSRNVEHTHSNPAQTISGDVETRPINIALNAIIKI
jgi:microcystin-dependent protein